MLELVANCSLLFTEFDLYDRPSAARAAGFNQIELWWPWSTPVPDDGEVDRLVSAVTGAGVQLAGLNFFAGDLAGPDCGALSVPEFSEGFSRNVPVVVDIAERLGTRLFNALYGNRDDGISSELQDELAAENLALAADAVRHLGGVILIEPVSGPKPYPLRTAADAASVVLAARSAGVTNVGMLLDIYHLAANGDDVGRAIEHHIGMIEHVQIADAPGRGEPGSGLLDLDGYVRCLERHGYRGAIALEYKPTGATSDGLS
ncbi:hydroxypyruvate isomerase family protein [Nocardioides sp.]|uniref:hydroxypyruvate isomerase family protein n=1 Tax=Nocardioides sp. TaxID=35761 RepID=UPI0037836A57